MNFHDQHAVASGVGESSCPNFILTILPHDQISFRDKRDDALVCRAIVEAVSDTLCALSEMAQKLIALHYNIL